MPWHLRSVTSIFLFSLVVYVYIALRLSSAVANLFPASRAWARWGVFLIVFLCNLFPLIILAHYLSGDYRHFFIFRNELGWQDYLFLFPFWVGLIIVMEALPYYLFTDAIGLFLRITKSSFLLSWTKWRSALHLAIIIFFVFFVGVKSYLDSNRVVTRNYAVPIKNLPAGLNEMSLVLFGDLQVDRYTRKSKLERVKMRFQEANGDMLLFAGDLVTSGETFIDAGIDLLCELEAGIVRISCLGDHDSWSNPTRISAGLRDCGWAFLENEHRLITHNDHTILVTGVVYIYRQRMSSQQIRELLSDAPPADLKILLVHQPAKKVIRVAKEFGYHLVLAGHTHGGQIVFRPFGFRLTPSMFENDHFSGLEREDELSVIVTNGIGYTLAPLRYNAPAEIVKIQLTSE